MNIAAVTALGAVSDVVALPGLLTTIDHRHVMVLPGPRDALDCLPLFLPLFHSAPAVV
jgi:hypothetical protein